LVIYGLVTETNIGKLFAAGFLPGILAVVLMCVTISFITWRHPSWGPRAEHSSWVQRWVAFKDVWAVALLFFIVMGGIYGGVFTATEGAGIGAFGAFCIALARKALTWRVTLDILIDSSRTTGMLFMILVGALIFGNFINFTSMPNDLKAFVMSYQISPISVMVAICVIYILLGTAMEELSMILLTIPVFFPLVVSLGFDPVWFGIIIVLVVMIGLISPPVGMNMFVVKSLLPHLDTSTIFRGVMPFVYTLVGVLALLVAFPPIILIVPQLLKM
jgi:tripartite ATP-independent transporter DctM subunit